MFIIKNNYYFYIENTKSINLDLIKKYKKITIIYRATQKTEAEFEIVKFRKKCHLKKIKFYIANNFKLAKKCNADGLYLSAYNKKIYFNIKVIGSAHNFKEINQKIAQKCKTIILSRLFEVNYKIKKKVYGIVKFNLLSRLLSIDLIPLGGIKYSNLLKQKLLNSNGFALLSELKKKPAISNRLF